MIIGKIVSSSSHIRYLCQVHGSGEAERLPAPADYGFGTFVGIPQSSGGYLVGIIHDTMLANPEFGSLGPRLSSQEELAVFSPDYLVEKVTLVSIIVLGAMDAGGATTQGVPLLAAQIDAPVRCLTRDETKDFHGSVGGPSLSYLPLLTATADPLMLHLSQEVISRVTALYPDESPRLNILRSNLAWRSRVEPAG